MDTKLLKLDGKKSFSILAGINRPILPQQVNKLSESINKMGVVRPVIVALISFISGRPIYYIIDGQHLFHACIRNKKDIPYIVIEIKDQQDLIETIALLNSSSKSWTMTDYITAWSYVKEDYKKLAYYMNIYSLKPSHLAPILYGSKRTGGSSSRIIKNGSFVIKEEAKAILVIEKLCEVLKNIKSIDRTKDYIIAAFTTFYNNCKNYNHSNFIKFIVVNKGFFSTASRNEEECLAFFEKSIGK